MLKSVTGLGIDAEHLIRGWAQWSRGAVVAQTDVSNGPKRALDLRALESQAQAYADGARKILADPGAAQLDAAVRDDLTAIAEECEAAVADFAEETEPDRKWAKLSRADKLKATAEVLVDDKSVERYRARLQGKLRGQKLPPQAQGNSK